MIDSGRTSSQVMSAVIAGVESVLALPYAAVASAFGWDASQPDVIADPVPAEPVNVKIRKRHLYLVGEPASDGEPTQTPAGGRVSHPTATPTPGWDKFPWEVAIEQSRARTQAAMRRNH